jgi:hypothetical protein
MSDRYTKTVLTVIAICLVVIAFQGRATDHAYAQTGPVHVIVDSVASFALQFAGPLAVKVQP